MAVTIDGSNTPTAGGAGYGDGIELAFTSAGTSGQVLTSTGSSAPTWQDAAGGAWEAIAEQTVATDTQFYEFTGLGAYNVIRVIVVHRNTGGGTNAEIVCGLSTGSSAQDPRDDDYNNMWIRAESGNTAQGNAQNTSRIKGYTSGDANKTYLLDASIYNFGQSEYTAYSGTSNHWQSTGYASLLNGYINYEEAYDYIRVKIDGYDTAVGSKIYVLGSET